jgi:hypothetical protein
VNLPGAPIGPGRRRDHGKPTNRIRPGIRRRADEKSKAKEAATPETGSPEQTSPKLYELLVPQIELEMQNQELRRTAT